MDFVELFAGCGGMALGLNQAGLIPRALIDHAGPCTDTILLNRPGWNAIRADVRNVDFVKYRGAHVLVGGFPCQPFTGIKNKPGFDDDRGHLFYYIIEALELIRPWIVLCENVKGLRWNDKGRTLDTVQKAFEDQGYKFQYRIMNAAHYGVAQKRERMILVATAPGVYWVWPSPTTPHTHPTLRDALKDVPEGPGFQYGPKKQRILAKIPAGGNWRDLGDDDAKELMTGSWYKPGSRSHFGRRLSWDEPCLTLLCKPENKMTERCHPSETRPFSVREYGRIQGFPDSWQFSGSVTAQYKMIGNAVPPPLARALGTSIIRSLRSVY